MFVCVNVNVGVSASRHGCLEKLIGEFLLRPRPRRAERVWVVIVRVAVLLWWKVLR